MTLYAQKANVVTVIQPAEIDAFVAKGYKVMDAQGRIIKDTAPDNLKTLQDAYVAHVAEINTLKSEIARLKDELTRAQEAVLTATKTETVEEKPKRTRTRRGAQNED